MKALDAGAAIIALRRTALPAAADAIRNRRSLDAINRAFLKRYRQVTGGDDPTVAWARLEARARVVAIWGHSDRKALADEFEELTGAPPPTLTVEALRAEVERLRDADDLAARAWEHYEETQQPAAD
jgi:hypothetical protein